MDWATSAHKKVPVSPGGWCWYCLVFFTSSTLLIACSTSPRRDTWHLILMQFQQLRYLEHLSVFTTSKFFDRWIAGSFALPPSSSHRPCRSYLFGQRTLASLRVRWLVSLSASVLQSGGCAPRAGAHSHCNVFIWCGSLYQLLFNIPHRNETKLLFLTQVMAGLILGILRDAAKKSVYVKMELLKKIENGETN